MSTSKYVSVCLSIAFGSAACGLANFDVDQDIPEQTIDGSPLPDVFDMFFEFPLMIDIESKIKAKETGPIDWVHLTSLELVITDAARPAGDSDDWSFVRSVDVFVQSTRQGSSLPRVRVARASSPGPVTVMQFDPDSDINLVPYINEGSQMTTEAEADVPPDDVSFRGRAVFEVNPL